MRNFLFGLATIGFVYFLYEKYNKAKRNKVKIAQ